MKSSLSAALVLLGSLGAASAAMAATPVVHHPAHPAHRAEATKAAPVRVMTEAPNNDPSLTDIFAASDGAFYTPVTHDPRIHGLPQY